MLSDKFNGLIMLSIEYEMLELFHYKTLMNNFKSQKANKVKLYQDNLYLKVKKNRYEMHTSL